MTARPITPEEADALFAPLARFSTLFLAVSGGPDSTALLELGAAWVRRRAALATPRLVVLTVDHGLRHGSAAEAAGVEAHAHRLGVDHVTLRWSDAKPTTGIQAAARAARYRLMHEAMVTAMGAAPEKSWALLTAHTAGDQAETVLMRLQRGSGVDGLAAIPHAGGVWAPVVAGHSQTVPVLRPLLDIPRARLEATLDTAGIAYVDDPSNEDQRFERVRVRQVLALLEPLDFTEAALARTAGRMQRAKFALDHYADAARKAAVRCLLGCVLDIDLAALRREPAEIGIRVLRDALREAGGPSRLPDLAQIEEAHASLARAEAPAPDTMSLGGCLIERTQATGAGPRLWIYREPDRSGGLQTIRLEPEREAVWDERFIVSFSGAHARAVDVGPLGDGLTELLPELPSLAHLPIPRRAARALPAFRDGRHILAVPALADWAATSCEAAATLRLQGSLVQLAPDHPLTGKPVFGARQLSHHRPHLSEDVTTSEA